MDKKNAQPHLLVRWMSAVYQTVPVILVPPNTTVTLPTLKVNGKIQKRELLIPDPTPATGIDYDAENEWTEIRRAALIKAAIQLSKQLSLNVCVVFGNDDAVYVDPSGRQEISTQSPSGGIDPITGAYYKEPELSQSGEKEQHKGSLGISRTVPPKEPLALYIQKGDIAHSTLYLSSPDDQQLEYPTLREYLEDIKYINPRSEKDLWQYIEDNGICDDIEISEHMEEGTDPTTLIGDLDEQIDGSSYEASEWMDQYYIHESPEALAFDFLESLLIRDVPGVALVQGDRPGSNLTFVEVKDSKALKELQRALSEEGCEVTIKRF